MHHAQAANQQLLHVKVTNLSAATLAMLMAKTASFPHPATLGLAAAWWLGQCRPMAVEAVPLARLL
jgi:hypothetical protein